MSRYYLDIWSWKPKGDSNPGNNIQMALATEKVIEIALDDVTNEAIGGLCQPAMSESNNQQKH